MDVPIATKPADTTTRHRGTFTLFPKLPIELRHQIWEYALPPGRILCLGRAARRSRSRPDLLELCQLGKEINTPLDQVCQESWKVLSSNLHRVDIEMSSTTGGTTQVSLKERPINRAQYQKEGLGRYFDCSRDSLLLSSYITRNLEPAGIRLDLSPVRHLALQKFHALNETLLWEKVRSVCHSLRTFAVILPPIRSVEVSRVRIPRPEEVSPDSKCYHIDEFSNSPTCVEEAKHLWDQFRQTALQDTTWLSVDFKVCFVLWEESSQERWDWEARFPIHLCDAR